MLEALKIILDIQEYDMKMIRLMRLKLERERELENIHSLRRDLKSQMEVKEKETKQIKTAIRIAEGEVTDVCVRIKNLEDQQISVKKVDEFNALSQQLNTLEKERAMNEQKLSAHIRHNNINNPRFHDPKFAIDYLIHGLYFSALYLLAKLCLWLPRINLSFLRDMTRYFFSLLLFISSSYHFTYRSPPSLFQLQHLFVQVSHHF